MDYKLNLGHSLEGVPLCWKNASNGHLALLGQSGRGKSYAVKKYLRQLPEQGVHAYVFDCAGDFREDDAKTFSNGVDLCIDVRDVRQQAKINPFRALQFSASYVEEPADTAARLTTAILDAYQFRGAAQPIYLRNALNDFLKSAAFLPSFDALARFIESDSKRAAKMQASLIRLKDLGRLFPGGGAGCDWKLEQPGITIFQFDTIQDRATQVLVTELLLSDLWAEKLQAQQEVCHTVVLLDECQRFSFSETSMLVRILREGRKYHFNGWFASQWIDNKVANQAMNQAALRAYFFPGDRNVRSLATMLCPDANRIKQYEMLVRSLSVGQFLYTDCNGSTILNCVPR